MNENNIELFKLAMDLNPSLTEVYIPSGFHRIKGYFWSQILKAIIT